MTNENRFESHLEFNEFLEREEPKEVISKIELNRLKGQPQHYLDIEFINRGTETLIFTFAGAYKRDVKKTLPFYLAKGFKNKVSSSIAYIADPSLYLDDIRLGWYGGDMHNNLQQNLLTTLKTIQHICKAKRVIFFGGSGGGFASLFFSRYFNNCLSIVWNPQIFIEKYNISRFKIIDTYSQIAFNCQRSELGKYICTDLANHIKSKEPKNNLIFYLQNITDNHVERDLKPLCAELLYGEAFSKLNFEEEATHKISEYFLLHLHNWSSGHRPPPRSVLLQLLVTLSSDDSAWSSENYLKLINECDEIVDREKFINQK
ncbi:hypothetical protein KL866_15475 [Alteromonas sp. ALT199]|uniref:hypothetical protein n=1 Tax=unclassified Alteromonas TaxID=2614992 RepID=UPI001BECA3DD|nr:hypothetical protein [Alteromonas sp. ALT199]MBT3136475.1 hypothetical protein [Alteromonas sp. ALT199]